MKDEFKEIIGLLGEKNVEKIKDGITDMILNRIKEEIDDSYNYFIDTECMFDEVCDEIREELKDKMKYTYMKKLEEKLDSVLK